MYTLKPLTICSSLNTYAQSAFNLCVIATIALALTLPHRRAAAMISWVWVLVSSARPRRATPKITKSNYKVNKKVTALTINSGSKRATMQIQVAKWVSFCFLMGFLWNCKEKYANNVEKGVEDITKYNEAPNIAGAIKQMNTLGRIWFRDLILSQ